MSELVIREDRDGCATLTLNRPEKLNALTIALFQQLDAHVEAIRSDPGIGVVVLRGGGKCFSAGHDLADIYEGEEPPEPNLQSLVIQKLADLPQPVITAVHGHCYTGGLELALVGDIIVASENAKFADTHARWALTPVWGISQRLPRRVGLPKAKEMMFTCRTIEGPEAAEIGLANMCVPDAQFEDQIQALTAQILENSWFSHRANKKLLLETDGMSMQAGLAYESYNTEGGGPDAYERMARFTKK
ncbi:Enoyl-CoA hydratase/carnithine racemase [Parasphingorhabdus marina DSM 22363]|uniref:Enoyl-CoA hydratase/carnithine racemase n=1 Tax=Parasphingorhabdus marina DSM 22363 TaxID=1123272 RepID=A0A1N6D1K8_9SPHN|nr:enoyl-CoA hydratase/isomerase family protein [Parasphingorhabdus marina]SIN64678.1 Enoyl-CoA hydratase/carnithine racemase [Parasphingorhabdus marina DSM 22363]